jgi:hypothetical protein
MTVVDEDTKATEIDNDDDDNDDEDSEGRGRGRTKDRDFTKYNKGHEELAAFVNANSGLDAVTPNQVKAILLLRTDFNDTPEQQAKREEAKKRREAEAEKYKGMTKEEIAAEKAAQRAEKQAQKLQARVAEALAKAQRIREGKDATGEDLAAEVEAAQNGSAPAEANSEASEENKPKRTIGRRK